MGHDQATDSASRGPFVPRPDFESIVNRSPAVAFLWRVADGWPVDFVSQSVSQFGYTAEEFLAGQVSWPGITHPDDVPRLEAELQRYFRDGIDEFNQEYRLFDKAGQIRWIEDRNVILRNPQGQITHIQGIIFDVTDRKLTEQKWQSRIVLERLIAELSTRLISLNPQKIDQGIDHVLAEIGRHAGVDRSYICVFHDSQTRATCTHEWCAPDIPPAIDQIKGVSVELFPWLTRRQLHGEVVYIPNVNDLPAEAAAEKAGLASISIQSMITVPLLGTDRVIGIVGFDSVRSAKNWTEDVIELLRLVGQMLVNALQCKQAQEALQQAHSELESRVVERTAQLAAANQSLLQEIAERKRAEEELHRRRQEFLTLVENTPDIIERFDRHLRIRYVNPAIEPPTGISPKAMIGKTKREIGMPPLICELWETSLHTVFSTGHGTSIQFEFPTPSRQNRYYHARFVPELATNGSIPSVLCIIRDVTEAKLAEENLRQAKQAAEAANEAKDRFLAILSHELRAPLSPVLLAASALEANPQLPAPLRQEGGLIRRNIEMEARLINDLLDLNRIAHGKLELQPRTIDLHLKIRNAVDLCRTELQDKRLNLSLHALASEYHVHGDGGRLQQILWNLIRNAVKFTPVAGHISLSTSNPQPGILRIEIADDGIGIEPQHLPHIFNAFEQGDPAITRQFGGLGLGLAICKALVEGHHGSLRAHSAGPGKGATFIVELPTCPAPAQSSPHSIPDAPPTPLPSTVPTSSAAQPPDRPLRLLVVDDHELTLRTLVRLLKASGHSVRSASNVASAKALADQESFDLLISDLGLPDGSGYELMEYVRQHHQFPGICLTGYGMEQDILRSKQAGFAEHLTKPVDITRLLTAITRAARPSSSC
ncbi:MAG: ATP-binding protein [Bacillota bacterium]